MDEAVIPRTDEDDDEVEILGADDSGFEEIVMV
jgi:hypothetical protein